MLCQHAVDVSIVLMYCLYFFIPLFYVKRIIKVSAVYDYYNSKNLRGNKFLIVGGLDIVKDYYAREIHKIQRYFELNPHAVTSQHFLVRLITHLLGSYNLQSPFDIYQGIDYKVEDLGMALQLTSNIYRGEVKKGFFYGKDSEEAILIYNKPYLDYHNSDWRQWDPIRIVSHASTDILINPIKPMLDPFQRGLSFITIDAVQLTLQYYLWRMEFKEDNDRSMMQFIATYPLVNMMYTHADVAVWNRFVYSYVGLDIPKNKNRFPIAIADYSNAFDKGLMKIGDNLKKRNIKFEDILLTVPMLYEEDVSQLFKIPKQYPVNRNNIWFFLGSRIRYFRFLFKYSKQADNHSKNKDAVAYIKRELRIIRAERIFEQVLKGSALSFCNTEIDNLINN